VGDGLKEYELLFIVSPRVAAEDVSSAVERVEGLVRESGGEVLSVDNWGRRRMAYPIKHYFEGTYVVVTLRMEPRAAAPLEASLIISEEVIRHLLTEGIIPPTSRDRGRPMMDDRDRDRERPMADDRDRERTPEPAMERAEPGEVDAPDDEAESTDGLEAPEPTPAAAE
jgi:small subunit ribosomal protein S6